MKRNLISFVSYCAKPQEWLGVNSRSEYHIISNNRFSMSNNNISILGTPAVTTDLVATQAGKDYSRVREGWDD